MFAFYLQGVPNFYVDKQMKGVGRVILQCLANMFN